MYSLLVFLLLLHGLLQCESVGTSMCQRFDATAKLLERYCETGHQIVRPPSCAPWQTQSIESYQVAQLKLAGCDYYAVSEAVIKYKYVTSVTIQYSRNFDLNVPLERLTSLIASQNALQTIPHDLFSHAPELRVCDFSHNKLSQLEWSSFQHARNLRQIYLAHNLLRTIQPEVVVGLVNLELIDVKANQLYSIPDFAGNKHLTAIHIQENPIVTYDCFHIATMKSTAMYLSWASFVTFDGAWHCSGKRMYIVRSTVGTAVSEGIFQSEPSGKIELHCNDRGFKNLREFTAGQNTFDNIIAILSCFDGSVETLDLSGNRVDKLESSVFRRFNYLRELRLSDTQLTSFDFSLIAQPNRLNLLDLSFNTHLRHFNNIRLLSNSFTAMREFKIAGNRLDNVPQIVENLSSSIETLDVSGNFIRTLNANAFRHFAKLKVLNVSDASLSITNENPFEHISTLLSLDLSHNSLGHTNYRLLSPTLNRLQYLYAVNCQIQNPSEIFHGLRSSIVELHLARNQIETIATASLQNAVNLAILDLSSNKLREIQFELTLNQLERLNLNDNHLTQINRLTRSQFRSLKSIDIARNQLDCSNVHQLMREWDGAIEFNNEQLVQTHGKDCLSASDDSGVLTKIYNKIKFW